MEGLGESLGKCSPAGFQIHLQGDLGAGKTTLVRGFLRGRGYRGRVKSPTYTLVEPYELGGLRIFHFDLYRMHSADELLELGFQDYLEDDAIILIEWPEKAAGLLQTPDLSLRIALAAQCRQLECQPESLQGENTLNKFKKLYLATADGIATRS